MVPVELVPVFGHPPDVGFLVIVQEVALVDDHVTVVLFCVDGFTRFGFAEMLTIGSGGGMHALLPFQISGDVHVLHAVGLFAPLMHVNEPSGTAGVPPGPVHPTLSHSTHDEPA